MDILFISEKRKKDYKDVMLVMFYFGLTVLMFSSLVINTIFFLEVLLTGIILIIIAIGMNVITLYYYIIQRKTKKPRIMLERILIIHILLCFLILICTLFISIGVKLRFF